MYGMMTKVDSETVTTKMGEFDCDVLQRVDGSQTMKIWVAKDPSILVKVEMDVTEQGQTMKAVGLVDTNMLQDTEPVPDQGSGRFVASTDPAVGDFVVTYGWYEIDGKRVEQTITKTVNEVSGGLVTYEEERDDGSVTMVNGVSIREFLDMSYIPDGIADTSTAGRPERNTPEATTVESLSHARTR